jgi:hypothetical protein
LLNDAEFLFPVAELYVLYVERSGQQQINAIIFGKKRRPYAVRYYGRKSLGKYGQK